jgi:hypothetical protein
MGAGLYLIGLIGTSALAVLGSPLFKAKQVPALDGMQIFN